MDPQQQFCLKWNSFGNNLVTAFDSLFKSESLTDVTLFCEGVTFKAHKLILAACSKHFQDLFEAAPHCPSVVVILDGTSSANMSALLEFMYKGEVHVSHESLSSFLKAAECLQVKGLSIEHEKLAAAQGHIANLEPQLDSPSGRSGGTKQAKSSSSGVGSKEGGGGSGEGESATCMLPPSSGSYTPALSPYMHHYMVSAYEQRTSGSQSATVFPYEAHPRKRQHRSPSDPLRDSSVRASVLRDGSKPERDSPLSLTYAHQSTPSPSAPPPDYPRQSPPNPPRIYDAPEHTPPQSNSAATAVTVIPTSTFERAAAVDSDTPKDLWHSPSSCPEDLRVKLEPPGVKPEWGGGGGAHSEGSGSGTAVPPDNTTAASDPSAASMWNSASSKILAAHKGATTPDGKKLQCPFCERLYGYETNLRAHIRQRHQGIRVPCPFCTRTFTRNNTVRRHIAREHKTELSLKAFQQPDATVFQVQNHNQ